MAPTGDQIAYVYAAPAPQNLVCPVCRCPFIDPVEHVTVPNSKCTQIFCSGCASQLASCPTCRNEVQWKSLERTPFSIRFLFDLLDELLVVCPSCNSYVARAAFSNHIPQCPVECVLGCGKKVKPTDRQAHEGECPNMVVPCLASAVMCPWTGPRSSLDRHVSQCSFNYLQPVLSSLLQQLKEQKEQADQATSLRQELKELKDLNLEQSTSYRQQLKELQDQSASLLQQSTSLRHELDQLKAEYPKCGRCKQPYLPGGNSLCKAHVKAKWCRCYNDEDDCRCQTWRCQHCGATSNDPPRDCNSPHSQ